MRTRASRQQGVQDALPAALMRVRAVAWCLYHMCVCLDEPCCSVLQCVAVCCSVLQCVAVRIDAECALMSVRTIA